MPTSDRPISGVLHDIVSDIQDIVRSEARLAKAEFGEQLKKSSSAGILIGAGVLMLALSGLFALLAIVYALSLEMPAWAAALIVAGGEALMAALFVTMGIRKFRAMRAMPKTAASMKENVEWAKQLTK